MQSILVFIFTFFTVSTLKMPSTAKYLVIWNVGQGQWLTVITTDSCLHIDVGGEFYAFNAIQKKLYGQCADKLNKIYISHWDWDHTLHIRNLISLFSDVCFAHTPVYGQQKSFVRKLALHKISRCKTNKDDISIWSPSVYKNTNDSSSVFTIDRLLISGDSPKKQEQVWSQTNNLNQHDIFLLGHHGSKTSNSEELLMKWPNLNQAIASARQEVYNHPHPEVLKRLSDYKIALLKTEKWNNIWIAF